MACRMKVIAPKSTGIVDYCNAKNSLLVPCEEKRVDQTMAVKYAGNEIPHLIKPWFKCWEPNFEELKAAMRKAYTSEMKFIRDGAARITKTFNLEHSLNQLKEAFELE
jgi:hypothetical protein